MSARAIQRMQELAFDGGPIYEGYLLGPWLAPGDEDLPKPNPFTEKVELSAGATVTLAEYWEAFHYNTRAVIRAYPDVFDIQDQAEEIYKGVTESQNGKWDIAPVAESSSYVHFQSLPLVGPFRIAPGWWQVEENRAVCIMQRGELDSYLAWNVVVRDPQRINDVVLPRLLSPTNAMLTVTPDGDVKLTNSEAAHTTAMLLADFAVCSVAMSIMQADPEVVHCERRHRAAKKARKTKKRPPGYEVMRTIVLPGLRYERATGSWHAKRSNGVAWHMVRGHYRLLKSEKFRNKQGQKVWVKPHSRGREFQHVANRKRYVPDSAR